MAIFLIGIDDTDNETSPGTGQLARRLAGEAAGRGATSLGITRHQFLMDERIPYTSHNSGACLAIEWEGRAEELSFAMELISEWHAEGSDPGVCVAAAAAVPAAMMEWGWAATRQVLEMESAIAVAKASGAILVPLGGTGQGIIGALASVGLRADGNEGRFLDLPGLRSIGDYAGPEDFARMGIQLEHHWPSAIGGGADSRRPSGNRPLYKTFGWVRPRLVHGKPVWPVEWSDEHDAWIPVDRKKSRPLE